ncbi:hypothetical protein BH09MYX1_BH09MYX1_23250 [soil metagenome]
MSDKAPISRASAIDRPESLRESSRLLLLSTESMRARRRPFAVLGFGAFQVLAGIALGWPIARTVASVYESHPRGDAPLFEDGGFALVRTLLEHDSALRALTSFTLVTLVAASLLGLVPIIAMFASLAHTTPDVKTPRARHLAPFIASTYGPMAFLWFASVILKGIALVFVSGVFGVLSSKLDDSMGDASADRIAFGVAFFLALIIPIIDVLQDLTRAALVRFNTGLLTALRLAFRTFRRKTLRVLFSYGWRAIAGILPIVAAAAFATRFGGKAGGALAALFLLHQSVIFARAALRASWFASALRAVDETNSSD